jgi:hypothetical protein
MTSDTPKWRTWLDLVRAPLILAIGAVIAAMIAREAIRLATAQRMVWWLPTLILIAILVGISLGLFSFKHAIERLVSDGKPRRPLLTIAALLAAGYIIAFWFGWGAVGGGLPLSLLMVAVMAAAMSVGALVGFLFGLPRFAFAQRQAAVATAGAADPARPPNGGTVDYKPSTNLDDVADWLSKIIVGLGLTQLAQVGTHLQNMTTWVLGTNAPAGQRGFLAALTVAGAIGGFLFGYVWTRLHYAELAADADVRTVERLRQQETKSIKDVGIGKGVTSPSAASASSTVRSVDGTVAPDASTLDPNKGRFGGLPDQNARRLSAEIAPSEVGTGLYRLTFTVSSTEPRHPLAGMVEFHLHPTFRKPIVTSPVVNGIATLTVVSYGAFTVGAVADAGRTRLELDLAQLPEATDEFKSK